MFGSVSAWFYSNLAGIQNAEGAVGYQSIVIQVQRIFIENSNSM